MLHGALASGLAGLVGASAGEPSPTVPSREVALADFGGGPEVPDNCAALREALAALARSGGGVVVLGTGTHRFLSASLGQGGIVLPPDITLRGAGRDRTMMAVTGDKVCNLFVATNVSRVAIEDVAIIGNNVAMVGATIYGSGAAIRWVLDAQATSDATGFRMHRVHLENFKGPDWVAIENASSFEAGHEMRDISIADISFRSRPGNCVGTDNISLNSAVLCINGHAGVIRNVAISDVSGDARHIKTGIILFHAIIDAALDRVAVANAGREAISDDVGAYAIQIYDNVSRMRGIAIRNPVITAPRSVGIYVATGTEISIINPVISGQTDHRDANLPKAAIVFNGTRKWSVEGGRLRNNWRDFAVAAPAQGDPASPAVIDGKMVGILADGSESGLVIRHARGHVGQGITISNCQWRTRGRAVLVDNIQDAPTAPARSGYIDRIIFRDCRFEAGAGARAMEIWGAPGAPAGGYVVEGCALSGTNPLFARDVEGSLRVANCEVRDLGTMAGMAAASLLNCARLDLRDATFASPGQGGIGIDLGGSKGGVRGLRFVKASHILPAGRTTRQLGRGRPAFACEAGQSIQNLERAGGEPALWQCVDGSRWSGG